MRIIGGELKRRKLHSPPAGAPTRPIPDMVRQALFNLLRGHTEGQPVFDAFAGTGAIGIEALSRGASRCVFVERDKRMAAVLQRNLDELGLSDRASVVIGDALGPSALSRCPSPVHLAFFDPPYPLVREPSQWPRVVTQLSRIGEKLTPDGFLVLRTPWAFYHEIGGGAEEGDEDAPPSDGKPRRGERPARGGSARSRPPERARTPRTVSVSLEDAGAEDLLDAFEAELVAAGGGGVGGSGEGGKRVTRTPVDLSIPGLVGPETHPYRHTAVHLYMRAPAGAKGAL
ncbi:MAG: hypothetical protein EA378_06475 [Phycisphaerales bacterium]|nr:MAG: hypothetical protein EA378_06475 [Phycisphaerales bacterium]